MARSRNGSRIACWALAALLLISGLASTAVRASDDDDAADAAADTTEEYEDELTAHLIVSKSRGGIKGGADSTQQVVTGRNLTIVIDIFNAGAATAKDVNLLDLLPSNAVLVEGTLQASFPRIAEGSRVKHSYVMSFTSGGAGQMLPLAQVTYKADDTTTQNAQSSAYGIYVLTPVQQIQRYALIAGSYASLGMAKSPSEWRNVAVIVGVLGAIVGGNLAFKSVSSAKHSRKRSKALRELEKLE